jgi:hypothetical protein
MNLNLNSLVVVRLLAACKSSSPYEYIIKTDAADLNRTADGILIAIAAEHYLLKSHARGYDGRGL